MIRTLRLLAPLSLAACAWFEGAKDTVEGLVEPVVAVGVGIVADPPVVPGDVSIDVPEELSGSSFDLFLADARRVSDLDEAPVSGLDVTLRACGEDHTLDEVESGLYTWVAGSRRCEGELVAKAGDPVPLTVVTRTPPASDADVPTRWRAGDDLVVDLSGAGWGSAVVVLVDTFSGTVLYDTRPASASEWFDVLTNQQDLSAVTVPGEAFQDDTLHALVVIGFARTPNRDLDEVNTALSVVAGGRAQTWGVASGNVQFTDSGVF